MIKRTIAPVTAIALGLFVGAGSIIPAMAAGQDGTSTDSTMQSGAMAVDGDTSKFMMEAAMGGMAEVEMGRLAASKAMNQSVKNYGQRMVDDHTKANDELKSIAAAHNVTLPTELDAKHKMMMDKMQAMSGAEFDQMYMESQIKDHGKMKGMFKKQAEKGKMEDVKAFAAKTLPVVDMHHRMAMSIDNVIDGNMMKGDMKKSDDSMKSDEMKKDSM